VIPARFRKALNLRPGDKVEMELEDWGDWCCGANRGERRSSRRGKFGRPVLLATEGTPPMTTEDVTASIEELS
jgi:bifunctional DNA-binding transcriptional regulator/antitoxin component of YhaV-PrlF toxin-antitoxin module